MGGGEFGNEFGEHGSPSSTIPPPLLLGKKAIDSVCDWSGF